MPKFHVGNSEWTLEKECTVQIIWITLPSNKQGSPLQMTVKMKSKGLLVVVLLFTRTTGTYISQSLYVVMLGGLLKAYCKPKAFKT